MDVQRACQLAVVVHHQHLVDAVLLHDRHGVDGQLVRADGPGVGVHDVADDHLAEILHLVDHAAQVAVGEHADGAVVFIHHGRHAHALLRDLHQCLGQAVVRPTAGIASPLRITSRTWVSRRRPSAPPGCERAKSSSLKPRRSSSATAIASPSASVTVVDAVGARFIGQASLATDTSRWTSASRARLDSGLPVIEMTTPPMRLTTGRIAISSALSPEYDMAMKASSGVTMPRSPCAASAGCTNRAGVPVDAKVAAILRPIWPDLPMPDTTTRPLQFSSSETACPTLLSVSRRECSAISASASICRASRASSSARLAVVASKAFSIVFSWVTLMPKV